MKFLEIFPSHVHGCPCMIGVDSWDKWRPAQLFGPPENCSPEEGGTGTWQVLDSRMRPAPWLEIKLIDSDRKRIDAEVFHHMEDLQCSGTGF